MDDLANAQPSTVLDAEPAASPTGGGMPNLSEPDQRQSLRDDIEAAFREQDQPKDEAKPDKDADAAKGDAKPEKGEEKPAEAKDAEEPKPEKKAPERAPDGKFSAKEPKDDSPVEGAPSAEAAADKERATQVQQGLSQAPQRFLPDAKEKWANTPRAVQRDVEHLIRESEERETQYRETTQRYERLRDFDELAQRNGRDLRESLAQVHQFENLMRENPIAALNKALIEVGPRKADGQPFSLYEVAQHIASQGPEGYQRMVAQPVQQQAERRADPQVEVLQEEIARIKASQVERDVIEPFKAQHPRYDELREDIAFFLKSGKIPQSLSHSDRLAAAYDMAVRINPASHVSQPSANDDPGPGREARRADPDFSGSKSIKSSPGSVTEEIEDQATGGESVRDSILKSMRRLQKA